MRSSRLLVRIVSISTWALLLPVVSSAWGQQGGFGDFGSSARASRARPDGLRRIHRSLGHRTGRLFITATIKSGWHIYSITQPEGGPLATKITLKPPAGVRVGDFKSPRRRRRARKWVSATW